MPVQLQITGAQKLQLVSVALRKLGDKDLSKELYAGLNRVTKPLRQDAKERGTERLPKRGGLAQLVAKTRLSARRSAGRDPGVRIVAAPNAVKDPQSVNRGRLLHPVFGHKWKVIQEVKGGWFTEPMVTGAPEVRKELIAVLDDLAQKIVKVSRR